MKKRICGLKQRTRQPLPVHKCLDFEQRMLKRAKGDELDKSVIHARVLGYMILCAPSVTVSHEVANDFHSCGMDDTSMSALGALFLQYFITAFKKCKGHTPASSDHPSRPSFEVDKKELTEKIKEAPRDHKDAKAQALFRDGHKCVVTGVYDAKSVASSSVSVNQEELRRAGTAHTECAHIVPESTYFNVSSTTGSSAKKDYSSTVLAVLKRFGYEVKSLNGPKVHSLHNVMTMQKDVHDSFDRLELYFEEKSKNFYRVKTFDEFRFFMARVPKIITFTTPDPVNLPVPDSALLGLHAACAKVAHLSGAGEYVDKLDRDLDDMKVLAHDGGSSDVLSHAISHACSPVGVEA